MSAAEGLHTGRYQRVTTAHPCAICGKPDWCVYDPIAGIAVCCRQANDTPDQRFHGYCYNVPPTPNEADERRVIELGEPWAGDIPEAEAVARDRMYRALARLCGLTDEDRAELKRRGLDDPAIAGRFFSYPQDGAKRASALRDLERFADSRGLTIALWNLPGVYCTAPVGGGRGFVNRLAGRAGLAILVPDAAARFIAVKVRARDSDRQTDDPRYTWLSTRDTPSHAPVYVARPVGGVRDHARVIVTEGAFKALTAARQYGYLALGLPGITTQSAVVPLLAQLRERGDLDPAARVCIAFDEEPNNPEVARRRDELVRRVVAAGWRDVALLRWDGKRVAKLDDALAAGLKIHETPVKAATRGDASPDEAKPEWRPEPYSMRALMDEELPPVRWAVKDLFPEGVTLLAAKPKKGKTTLMMHVSAAVAAGAKACGFFATEQSEVLYLALEDNKRRMQKRMRQMMRDEAVPEGLHVIHEWLPLDAGGTDALAAYLDQQPAIHVVVVDTLEHIRPKRRSQGGSYADDYASVRGLQQLASQRQIVIVPIVHLRKAPADDPFDEINATTGLLASVDNALVMRPNAGIMELHRRGRDYEDDTVLALKGDAKTLLWSVEGKAEEVTRSAERKQIIEVLRLDARLKRKGGKPVDGMMPKEIALALDKNPSTTRRLLEKLLDESTPAIRKDDATDRYHAIKTDDPGDDSGPEPDAEDTKDDTESEVPGTEVDPDPLAFTPFTPDLTGRNGHRAASEPAPSDARSRRSQRSHDLLGADDDPPTGQPSLLSVNSVNSVNSGSTHEREIAAGGRRPPVAGVHAVHSASDRADAEEEDL